MRRLFVVGGFAMLTVLASVVATLSATSAGNGTDNLAPVTREAGARMCGYIIMPLMTDGKTVAQNLAILAEVPEDDGSLCDKALPKIRDEIKTNPKLANLSKYYSTVKVTGEDIANGAAKNKWVYFENNKCETVGDSFGGKVGNNDICESGHPLKGMDRLSKSEATHHVYIWTHAFFSQDPATGAMLGCDGKPASQTNAPCKLATPKLTKQTISKK